VIAKRQTRLLSVVLIFTGLIFLAVVLVPVTTSYLRFLLYPQPQLMDPSATSGRPATFVVNAFGLASVDYTLASNWFSSVPVSVPTPPPTKVTYFTLSAPALDLVDIPVEINGSDLKKNAIHFPGTSLPGNFGNSVIFGHSSLPQMYRPGYPLTIFNLLPKIKTGDDVIIRYDGITYRYLVRKTQEVRPQQIEVLSQHFDKYQLTLVTCVPLGTYWRRFVAIAELAN